MSLAVGPGGFCVHDYESSADETAAGRLLLGRTYHVAETDYLLSTGGQEEMTDVAG